MTMSDKYRKSDWALDLTRRRERCPHCQRMTKHAQADVFVFCLACSNPGVSK